MKTPYDVIKKPVISEKSMMKMQNDKTYVFEVATDSNKTEVKAAVEAIFGAGKNVMVVGFDATDDAIAAILEGRMAATIAQQPALIGSTAVENAVKLISGQGIAPSIPVEVTLITAENAG